MAPLTDDLSPRLIQGTLWDLTNATSFAESLDGQSPCELRGGQKICHASPGVVHASHGLVQGKRKAKKTKGTCGPTSSKSSKKADRNSCSESKSQAVTLSDLSLKLISSPRFKAAITQKPINSQSESRRKTMDKNLMNSISGGSLEFVQTWKKSVTLCGSPYWGHTAYPRRTKDKDCTGWPTSRATDGEKNLRTLEGIQKEIDRKGNLDELPSVAKISAWATENTVDAKGGSRLGDGQVQLCHQAKISAWPTTDKNSGNRGGVTEYKPIRPSGHQAQMSLNDAAKMSSWLTPRAKGDAGGNRQEAVNLEDQAKLSSWPTPNTPTGGPNTKSTENHTGGMDLDGASTMAIFSSSAETEKSVALNPEFSRWLMGFQKILDEASPNYDDWVMVQKLIAKDGSKLTVMPFKSE